jgi:hypothetical protein
MFHPMRSVILSFGLAVGLSAAAQPILPAPYGNWMLTIPLYNLKMEVVVAPEAGRILHIGYRQSFNLLRLDPDLADTSFLHDASPPAFLNIGGDWLWPLGQGWWPSLTGADWPPPPVLAEAAWDHDAVRPQGGGSWCELRRTYDEPLNLKVTRRITLDPREARFTIDQRAVRTGPSDWPAALWSVSQLDAPTRVFLPVDPSEDDDGLQVLVGERPGRDLLTIVEDVAVLDVKGISGDPVKLGSASRRAWVAAQKKHVLILQKMRSPDYGPHPDGCTVEVYVSPDDGYAEIETLSSEHYLAEDASVENTVFVELHLLPTDLKPEDAARRVRELAGE